MSSGLDPFGGTANAGNIVVELMVGFGVAAAIDGLLHLVRRRGEAPKVYALQRDEVICLGSERATSRC